MSKTPLVVATLAVGAAVAMGVLAWKVQGRRVERESRTAIEAIHKVARLSTVEMNVSSFQLKRDAKDLLGFIPIKCEKTVAIFYRGKVAAGFDFQPTRSLGIRVDHSNGRRKLVVDLPPPQLLYTDAPPPEVVVADGSVCNGFEPSDYEHLHVEARTALQQEALKNGILRQAELHARELVQAVATPLGFETEIRVAQSPLQALRGAETSLGQPAASR
jgi:hypothetical protein